MGTRNSGAENPRTLIMEWLRNPETAERVAKNLMDALQSDKLKPTETVNAMKVVDWLSGLMKEDEEEAAPVDLSDLDLSQCSIADLRALLARLLAADGRGGPDAAPVAAPIDADGSAAMRAGDSEAGAAILLRLEDFL